MLLQMKMIKSSADYNMYICKREGKLTMVLLYVNDLLLTGDSATEVQRIKRELMTQFKMSDLGEVQMYLRAEMVRIEAGIWMHQRSYITKNTGKVQARAMQSYKNPNGSWNTLNERHEVFPRLC